MIEYLTDRQIEQKVIQIVTDAKTRFEVVTGCSGENVCAKIKLRLERDSIASGRDGLYHEDASLIVVNRELTWQPRIEFTIFHEIMHYLIVEDGDLYSYLHDLYGENTEDRDTEIERCCEMGAAEFLMPQAVVRQSIVEQGFTIDLIEQISREHGASLVASAIQMAVCAPVRCYVVICDYGWTSVIWPQRKCLFVEYASRPSSNRYPLARFLPIPHDHLFYQAWQQRGSLNDRTYVLSRKGTKNWECDGEAKYINGRVVGLLLLDQPINHHPGQLTLAI